MSSDKNIEERFEQMADEIAALKVELAKANELISTLRAEIAQKVVEGLSFLCILFFIES